MDFWFVLIQNDKKKKTLWKWNYGKLANICARLMANMAYHAE